MRYIVAMLAVLVLAGCSDTPVAQTAPEPTPVQRTAGEVANAMALGAVTVWTAETDDNKLLGRPGGYTSAATIVDKRIPCTEPATSCGATVEVFPTVEEAQARSGYIQSVLGGVFGTEYHTVMGTTLLRVTGQLTPAQAKVYADKFAGAASK